MTKNASCLLLAVCLGLFSCAEAARPGLENGLLRPCPGSPNCVISELPGKNAEPIKAADADAWERLRGAVVSMGGSIEREEDGYLHATFRSSVFGFVDDLECRRDGNVIQVRSGARTGWWDMGVNRRRVERLRALLDGGVTK